MFLTLSWQYTCRGKPYTPRSGFPQRSLVSPVSLLTRLSGIPYRKPSKYKKYVGIASTCTGGWGVPCVRGQASIFIFVLETSLILYPTVNPPNLPDKLYPNPPQINIAPTRTRARFVICHIKCMVYSMGMHHD